MRIEIGIERIERGGIRHAHRDSPARLRLRSTLRRPTTAILLGSKMLATSALSGKPIPAVTKWTGRFVPMPMSRPARAKTVRDRSRARSKVSFLGMLRLECKVEIHDDEHTARRHCRPELPERHNRIGHVKNEEPSKTTSNGPPATVSVAVMSTRANAVPTGLLMIEHVGAAPADPFIEIEAEHRAGGANHLPHDPHDATRTTADIETVLTG